MKLKSKLAKTGNNQHYIPIPEAAAATLLKRFGKRVVCTINKVDIHCAVMGNATKGFYIGAGKSTRQKIKAETNDPLLLEFKKGDTKHQALVSEELQEVLSTDPEGQERFDALTPGRQRSIIFHVGKAKQSDTRINRILKIVENLKLGKKDLRELIK